MINNMNILMTIQTVACSILGILLIILAVVFINMKLKEKESEKESKKIETSIKDKPKSTKVKEFTVDSVFDFMEFEKIEDNMIVQNKGNKYIMVVECQGINYDLMSQEEKVAVEEGFIQFLNTISSPIQLYVQTRKINLESSLQSYKDKMYAIENNYVREQAKYNQLIKNPNATEEQINKEYYELVKQKNVYEYGKDIIFNTERMSLNKNILNKKYYVVLSYYATDANKNNLDKNEVREMAFSELYTKSQAVIRALSTSGVIGKVLSSTELVDLLYVAYNRDESDTYGIDKAIKARYDEIYSTAPDYMDKKIKMLNEEIERKAYDKANQMVIKAQSEKEKEYNEKSNSMDDFIDSLAEIIIEQNANQIGQDVADKAKEELGKERKNNVQETKGKARSASNRT